jgi:predicted PhzF superfamily epimerase YddE/YHI9
MKYYIVDVFTDSLFGGSPVKISGKAVLYSCGEINL